jgi:hypothetical protein
MKPELVMTEFLAAFRAAYKAPTVDPNLIEFSFARNFDFFIPPATSETYKFLIQGQYTDLWNLCEERYLRGTSRETRFQSIFIGTAGIGKSAGRLLYICRWLEKETEAMNQFESVIFNFSNAFYEVDVKGVIKSLGSSPSKYSSSLLLLKPCDFLNGAQFVACSMLIVFASPSPLVGQPSKPSLSGLMKKSRVYVMTAPTLEEARKLYYGINEERVENFSWMKDGVRYCSLRWFGYDDDEIEDKLKSCLSHVSRDALWEWFVSNTEAVSNDYRLPFRLCVVEGGPSSVWTVTQFISPGVERFLHQWAMGKGRRKANEIACILQNRMLRGGLEIFFEKWLFDALGEGLKLNIPGIETVVSHKKQTLGVSFIETKIIPQQRLETEANVVYKLDRATFPSIEGYAIVDNMLLLLQSTVSESHSGARFKDVESIIKAAGSRLQTLVVYIAPSGNKFHLPQIIGFPEKVRAVRGFVNDSDFVATSKHEVGASVVSQQEVETPAGGASSAQDGASSGRSGANSAQDTTDSGRGGASFGRCEPAQGSAAEAKRHKVQETTKSTWSGNCIPSLSPTPAAGDAASSCDAGTGGGLSRRRRLRPTPALPAGGSEAPSAAAAADWTSSAAASERPPPAAAAELAAAASSSFDD